MPKIQTFKVQRSIVSPGGIDMCLIYNEGCHFMGQFPLDGDLLELFPPGALKIYVRGTVGTSGIVDIRGVVLDEDW